LRRETGKAKDGKMGHNFRLTKPYYLGNITPKINSTLLVYIPLNVFRQCLINS